MLGTDGNLIAGTATPDVVVGEGVISLAIISNIANFCKHLNAWGGCNW